MSLVCTRRQEDKWEYSRIPSVVCGWHTPDRKRRLSIIIDQNLAIQEFLHERPWRSDLHIGDYDL